MRALEVERVGVGAVRSGAPGAENEGAEDGDVCYVCMYVYIYIYIYPEVLKSGSALILRAGSYV